MATYRSDECRTKSLALYNKQIKKLDMPFSDIYINTEVSLQGTTRRP